MPCGSWNDRTESGPPDTWLTECVFRQSATLSARIRSRLYHDRTKWSKSDTADPVLHVVVYNGDRRWDAPVTFAGLLARAEEDGAAHLALRYEVLDLWR